MWTNTNGVVCCGEVFTLRRWSHLFHVVFGTNILSVVKRCPAMMVPVYIKLSMPAKSCWNALSTSVWNVQEMRMKDSWPQEISFHENQFRVSGSLCYLTRCKIWPYLSFHMLNLCSWATSSNRLCFDNSTKLLTPIGMSGTYLQRCYILHGQFVHSKRMQRIQLKKQMKNQHKKQINKLLVLWLDPGLL